MLRQAAMIAALSPMALTAASAQGDTQKRVVLPAPFVMTVEAKRQQLPAPFVMSVEAKRLKVQLPAPFVMTVEAKRQPLPAPFVMEVEAKRLQLPEPFVMTVEAKRQPLPAPFVMEVEAKRLQLPEPFVMTVEATKSADCTEGEKTIKSAKELADGGEYAKARQALGGIKTESCPDLIPEIDAARTRIADLEASRAEAALDACKFSRSHRLIDEMPEGARRTALITRWTEAYRTERQARDMVKEAVGLRAESAWDKAIAKLNEARNLKPCDATIKAIGDEISKVESERDEGHRRCRAKYGEASFAIRRLKDGKYECGCGNGFVMNDARSACIRRPPTVADGHPVCRREFGPEAYAIAVNPNGTFKCRCRNGYTMKNRRCVRVTIADGHRQCRTEFGAGAYAVRINPNGTFQCQCRDGYRWKEGRKRRCVRLTIADGHAACRRQFGPLSRALSYRGHGSWNCYIPPRRPPPTIRRPPPPHGHSECPPGYNPYGCR